MYKFKLTVKLATSLSEVSRLSETSSSFTCIKFENNVLTLSKFGHYSDMIAAATDIYHPHVISVVITKDN